MNIEIIEEEIMKNGYYIIKGYLNNKECVELVNAMNNYKHLFIQANSGIANFQTGGDYRAPEFHKVNETANRFLNDKRFQTIVENLYNRKIVKKRCQGGILIYKNDKTNSSGGGWHVDNYDLQLKAMIYLNDVNSNNGPFTYINNTNKFARKINPDLKNHRFTNDIINNHPLLKNINIQELTGNAGDCILFRSDNIHKGKIIENGNRYTLTNYYY
tara:strand:+ start:120 stop:764 length:645 start_codon:yes stop_codon:yes gene_type:complete